MTKNKKQHIHKKQILLTVLLIGIIAIFGYQILKLSYHVNVIENRLGGRSRVICNENDTVKRVRKSVVRIIGGESEGSGFAIQKGGYILTNHHVIESEPNPKVMLPDNSFVVGKVIMADKDTDLAVIKINKDLPALNFVRIDNIGNAEDILSIGYPLGGDLPGESTVIKGTFSRRARDKKKDIHYLLTDMHLIEGASGGPMVNICGNVVGINTAGLSSGGIGLAVASDSIIDKCQKMASMEDPLKDVKKIIYEPNKNPLEATRCFYNYLKCRSMRKAFSLLSDNFVKGYSFNVWQKGYKPMIDTNIIVISPDRKIENRINVKLTTKDLIDDEIVYKCFEGYWDVRNIDGRWFLWKPRIREVFNPQESWFLDQNRIEEIEVLAEEHEDLSDEGKFGIYYLSQEPGNEYLTVEELYDMDW
ncbi:MAG: trypsin-like peptidase domain-containing protein [Candidatus Gygaella obscura]|nr:trypsin-like peptidase domain-containing protein [Candidatus Gygaella obscura]